MQADGWFLDVFDHILMPVITTDALLSFFFFRHERLDYYKKRELAIKLPNDYLSLIIDGMDQSKTGVPHFRGWSRPKVSVFFFFLLFKWFDGIV